MTHRMSEGVSGDGSGGRPSPGGASPAVLAGPAHPSPVERGTRADAEGLDGLQYVTGTVPYRTQEERLLDEERTEVRAQDARDWEGLEEVGPHRIASDEQDPRGALEDVERQGRRGQGEQDWTGDMSADSGRDRPSDGARKRR